MKVSKHMKWTVWQITGTQPIADSFIDFLLWYQSISQLTGLAHSELRTKIGITSILFSPIHFELLLSLFFVWVVVMIFGFYFFSLSLFFTIYYQIVQASVYGHSEMKQFYFRIRFHVLCRVVSWRVKTK